MIHCMKRCTGHHKVLSENIPTARALVIKGAGHFPHMESPKPSMKCYGNGSKRK